MLNMNTYADGEGRFQHGFNMNLFSSAFNRYANGEYRGILSIGMVESSGTGHWPFTVFDFRFLTGGFASWQLTVLGFTVGSKTVHDIDMKTGQILGKDKKMLYAFFSCFNHKDKQLEEIIKPTI